MKNVWKSWILILILSIVILAIIYASFCNPFLVNDSICDTDQNIHLGCVNGTCTIVEGSGENECNVEGELCGADINVECSSNADCPNPTRLFCDELGRACVQDNLYVCVNPDSVDAFCERTNASITCSDCDSGCSDGICLKNETHFECVNEQCLSVAGAGENECNVNAECSITPAGSSSSSGSGGGGGGGGSSAPKPSINASNTTNVNETVTIEVQPNVSENQTSEEIVDVQTSDSKNMIIGVALAILAAIVIYLIVRYARKRASIRN